MRAERTFQNRKNAHKSSLENFSKSCQDNFYVLCINFAYSDFSKLKIKNVTEDISNDNEMLKIEFANFRKPLKDIWNHLVIKF